jgi:hypothetical protein
LAVWSSAAAYDTFLTGSGEHLPVSARIFAEPIRHLQMPVRIIQTFLVLLDCNMAEDEDETVKASEQTPLLPKCKGSADERSRNRNVVRRILLCAFMVSLSFGVTQVP